MRGVSTTLADLLREAAERSIAYRSREGRASPSPEALAQLKYFPSQIPDVGADPREILEQLDAFGSPATMRTTGGRYFGFVTGGCEPIALAASLMTAAWDQNAALPVMSPVAAHLDRLAARWVVDVLGLPASAVAAFCSGASVANLTCIVAARDALLSRAGWDVDGDGLVGSPAIRVVASAEIHVSVRRALRLAGIGARQITWVPTDARGRLRPDLLPECDDLTLVLLQAGNVNTGHCDPFGEVVTQVRRSGGWVHVDGAFGLWAAAAPELRHLVAGVEQADSWATDAHKWLNVGYDSGLAICARETDLQRAMAMTAAYVPTTHERAPMQLGIQMSQRARGIETWALLATKGRAGVAAMVSDSVRLAGRMADRLAASGAELLAPVVLNQVLVAFGDDVITDAVIEAVQAEGTCWVGGTTWQGRRAMRISVSDSATQIEDVDRSVEAIVGVFQAIRAN